MAELLHRWTKQFIPRDLGLQGLPEGPECPGLSVQAGGLCPGAALSSRAGAACGCAHSALCTGRQHGEAPNDALRKATRDYPSKVKNKRVSKDSATPFASIREQNGRQRDFLECHEIFKTLSAGRHIINKAKSEITLTFP